MSVQAQAHVRTYLCVLYLKLTKHETEHKPDISSASKEK